MKKYLVLFVALIVVLSMTGCSKEQVAVATEQKRAVKVQEIQEQEQQVKSHYIGTTDAKEIIKYSFKTGGQIGHMYVEKGDKVKSGDKLFELVKNDLEYQLTAAQHSMETARLNMIKAQDALTYSKSNMTRQSELYAAGTIAKDQLEQLTLQDDITQSNFSLAETQYKVAETDYAYKLGLVQDATIYAKQDGLVLEILSKENERVGADVPVISVRSVQEVINIGIPQQDLEVIHLGSKATIVVDKQTAEGVISNIREAPDLATRTYTAEVTVSGNDFRLGSIAKVAIDIGSKSGVWIPLDAVFSSGENYVYIVKDGTAFKRTIELLNESDTNVLVKGLKVGEFLATSGMKNLTDGSGVNIAE